MATVKRRLFTIFAAVSLVLCLAVAATWVGAFGITDCILLTVPTETNVSCSVDISPSGLRIVRHVRFPQPAIFARGSAELRRFREQYEGPPGGRPRWLGFQFGPSAAIDLYASDFESADSAKMAYKGTVYWFLTPSWLLVAITGTLPAFWFRRWRRDRRATDDGMPHCTKCGYNLTGNVSGICPECGTPVQADLVRRPVT